jgi:predicted ATPase/DNA-binding CsgD family transcriptional regulator
MGNVRTVQEAGLSPREAEVLGAVGRHLTNAQIGSRLHISVRTVESHVSSLLRKLGVPDRRALADLAPAVAAGPRGGPGGGPVAGLPSARTSFIGREREQAVILRALAGSRVVCLVGPGGVGKTRLAARTADAAAAGYALGAAFVDLVPVREGFLSQAVAAVLGVAEGPGRPLEAALHEYFGSGRSLLVLDNCEHLIAAVAPFIEQLLAGCPGLTVLATSRERLAIPGEQTVVVPPLSLLAEDLAGGASRSEAAAMFSDRARAADPFFTASPSLVADVCARLDGLPLAIELAAARSASLGVDGLLAGLDDHLRLLAGSRGPHERHRSLRAVIDWSHDLLDGDERAMFRQVGVFAAGFDLDAAMAVSAHSSRGTVADLIGRLTDKSLLTHRRGPDGSRWQMLGTIRAYAEDQLAASGEETTVRAAHLGWAASIADGLEGRAGRARPWRAEFDAVADDLRAAAMVPGPEAGEVSYRLARALGHLTYARGFLAESRDHYRAAAGRAPSPGQAAADLRTAAEVAMAMGEGAMAFELLLASAERAAAAGDGSARAVSLSCAVTIADRFAAAFPQEVPHDRLRQLLGEAVRSCPAADEASAAYLAAAAAWTGLPEKTVPDPVLADDALAAARLAGDPVLISGALDAVIGVLDAGGRLREAHQLSKERARLLERLPRHDPRAGAEIVDTYHMVNAIAVTAGDLPEALAAARMAEADDIAAGQPHLTASKFVMPLVLQGRFDEASARAAIMWDAWEQAGRPAARWMGPALYGMILAHGLRGDDSNRRRWLARVSELIGAGRDLVSGSNLAAVAAFTEARITMHRSGIAATADLPRESWYDTPHWYSLRPYAWAIAAEVAVISGQHDAADRLAAAAPAGDENYWAAACLARAAGRLRGDRQMIEKSIAGWERIEARFERACTLMLLEDRASEGLAELRALRCPPPAT